MAGPKTWLKFFIDILIYIFLKKKENNLADTTFSIFFDLNRRFEMGL